MKNPNPKHAVPSPKAGASTQKQQQLIERLLTVTLDAQASACTRRFAEEFGEDVRDVASGSILDSLPQALEEWDRTKLRRAKSESDLETYWQGVGEGVAAARLRRGAVKVSGVSSGALYLTLTFTGATKHLFLAVVENDGQTPLEWLQEVIASSLDCALEYKANKASEEHQAQMRNEISL